MSWFSPLRSSGLALGLVIAAATLGGCSFSPVYGEANAARAEQFALSFARPGSRLEQIIYQELAESFGNSATAEPREARVALSVVYADAALSQTGSPYKPLEVTITGTLTVAALPGGKPIVLTRTATASFTKNDQVLADRMAGTEAAERAAQSVAESLRLGLLAVLSR